ncbi:hypothetical protein [Brevibacillus parabrevis]|uniref:hypothetical protein n=1 Tax=Brevibacillus parabrevis TaxID=54914 RepID=UPI002E24B27B|nr:hypothetical protein [Brevibacillus parabrevis]
MINSLIRRRKSLESNFSNYEASNRSLEYQIQDLMESILYWLKTKGDILSFKELYNLKNMLPNNKDVQDAWNSVEELYLKSESDRHKFEIFDLKSIIHDDEFSIIRSEEQLMEVIFEALDDLQSRLNQKECSIKYLLWNVVKNKEKGDMFIPKDESSLSDFIKWHLDTYFYNRRIHFNREVHISTFPERNILDIKCQGYNDNNKNMEVYIEVKGSWNSHLLKSMESQLLNKYMQKSPYGLYIVGWFLCDAWKKYSDSDGKIDSRFETHVKKKSFEQAKEELDKQAVELSVASGKQVRAYILDFRLN